MARVKNETPALELLEEALHLLRNAPAALVFYYLGAIPFVMGLLFFWADMSRSAYAASRCASGSLLLAAGFVWMKCGQAVFARALWRRLGTQYQEPWNLRRLAALALVQTIIQPWGLVLFLPVLLITVPLPFFIAFLQNVTVFGQDDRDGLRGVLRRARIQAMIWPAQTTVLGLYLCLFSLLVFLNVVMGLGLVPHLLKMFLGVQSRFVQSPWAFANSTFLAAACALTYLCVDPLLKAAFVLRCYYGESLRTGEAIWSDLRRLKRAGALALMMMLVASGICWGNSQPAGRNAEPEEGRTGTSEIPVSTISPGQLDRAIQDTLRSPRYTWRMPRELKVKEPDEKRSLVEIFVESIVNTITGWIKTVFEWIDKAVEKLADWFRSRSSSKPEPKPVSLAGAVRTLTLILIWAAGIIVVISLAYAIYTIWRNRPRLLTSAVTVEAQPATPDLADERTSADQLPTDGWLLLAQQMIDRGELRLALRALYLASLAHLAQAGLIRIRSSKSNLDYVRELLRRAHAWPGLEGAFRQSVAAFDQAWYGMHEVTLENIQDFKGNYEKIKGMVR